MNQAHPPRIILASTSEYRLDLLSRLQLRFEQIDPIYTESGRSGETPNEKAIRHSLGKAISVSTGLDAAYPYIVIGSDQVAHLGNDVLPKPVTLERPTAQLSICSGQWVSFTTAICLVDEADRVFEAIERFQIKYRKLSLAAIARYLEVDKPFDCAGSIKVEASGISLIEDTRGRDINTVYGLPLMLLQESLKSFSNYSV